MNNIEIASTEQAARTRVENSTALFTVSEIIWSDWENMDEHIEWVATAPESAILAWAAGIAKDVQSA